MVTKVAAASGLAFVFVYILADIWGTQNWAYHDQVTYHLPFVNRLVEAGLDPFTDGTTATTPGAHLLYAAASVIFSAAPLEQNSPLIVVLGSLVAASTVGALLSCLLRLSGGWVWTPVLLIAVLSSQYFLLPAAYFVTDGLSFLFLALFFSLVAGGALHNSRLIAGAFARGALVLTRQIYLPMATAMAVIAFANPQWKNLQHPTILVPTVIAIALPAIAFLPF